MHSITGAFGSTNIFATLDSRPWGRWRGYNRGYCMTANSFPVATTRRHSASEVAAGRFIRSINFDVIGAR
jgi:hypothetical protein